MIRSQITKFMKILCHENLELYGISSISHAHQVIEALILSTITVLNLIQCMEFQF